MRSSGCAINAYAKMRAWLRLAALILRDALQQCSVAMLQIDFDKRLT